MVKRIFLFLFLFPVWAITCRGFNADADSINKSLNRLDDIISHRDKYNEAIVCEISGELIRLKQDSTPLARYNTLRSLFNLYRTYKIDSAIIIADLRLREAGILGENSKVASATLNLAEGYAKSGNTDLALSLLNSLDKASLAPHQLKYANSIYKTAYYNKAATALLPSERIEAREKLNNLRSRELTETDRESRGYLALQAERLRDAGMYEEAVALMEDMQRKFDIGENASLLYEMGETYLEAGKEDEAVIALSKSAILDLSAGRKEYKSLILLAYLLFKRGEVERSFAYINRALEDATFSKANIRMEEIMKIMPGIYQAFSEKEREIKRRTAWFLGAIGLLNVLLVVLAILLIKAHRANRRMIEKVNDINDRLKLQNEGLRVSDNLKMEHLKSFMMAYAAHISRLKTFRKSIHRLLRTSQYTKALEKIREQKDEAPDNSAFQEMFDSAFLSMFPDFATQMNKFLKDPIEVKDFEHLTPELRIAALMKLGITSTREITEMFQYSSQSVYNLRSTLRNRLKIDWDSFESQIRLPENR